MGSAHKQQLGGKSRATDVRIRRNLHSPNQFCHKEARDRCSATTVKVLDIGNQSVVQRLVSARIRRVRPHQSSQMKTSAMVAQSCKDGEEAFTCVKVEGTRSKRNLKKSGTEGSISSDRVVCSAVCRTQSNDGQTYISVGKLNRWLVKVLRDTAVTGWYAVLFAVPRVMMVKPTSV